MTLRGPVGLVGFDSLRAHARNATSITPQERMQHDRLIRGVVLFLWRLSPRYVLLCRIIDRDSIVSKREFRASALSTKRHVNSKINSIGQRVG